MRETFFAAKFMVQQYHNKFCTHAGISIVCDQFRVGSSAMARCSSDITATRIEWLKNLVIVTSAIFTSELVLMFSPVNDSIHNQVYVCRVTRDGGVALQNFTANVDGKEIIIRI